MFPGPTLVGVGSVILETRNQWRSGVVSLGGLQQLETRLQMGLVRQPERCKPLRSQPSKATGMRWVDVGNRRDVPPSR